MKNFIVFIVVIIGICLLSYYGTWNALTLTGGFAWLGLVGIIYLVSDALVGLGNWITKKRTPTIKVKCKRCELTDEELMKRLNGNFKKD